METPVSNATLRDSTSFHPISNLICSCHLRRLSRNMTERILPMELKRRRKKDKQSEAKNGSDGRNCTNGKRRDQISAKLDIESGGCEEKIKASEGQDIPRSRIRDWFVKHSDTSKTRTSRLLKNKRRSIDMPKSLESNQSIPFELTPYAKVILITPASIPFLRPKASVQFEATKCFLSNNKETESADLPPERSWYHAMLYYMYPSETAPCRSSSVLKNGFMSKSRIACEEDNNESDFYKYYLQQWQDALRAAYHNYRLKAKTSPTLQLRSYFYVHTTEYTVCFYGESPKCEGSDAAKFSSFQKSFVEVYRQRYCSENSNIHQEQGKNKYKFRAVVTQSNARLRKDLTEANVSFRMPFCRSSEIQCQPISSDPPMRVSDTALVFEGHLQIHGLYEYLLNQKALSKRDLPTIYSQFPFLYATLQTLRVKNLGRIAHQKQPNVELSSESLLQSSRDEFGVELTGFIFPETLQKLLSVLQREWDRTELPNGICSDLIMEAIPQPLPCTQGLNILLTSNDVLSDVFSLDSKVNKKDTHEIELELAKKYFEKISWCKGHGSGTDTSYTLIKMTIQEETFMRIEEELQKEEEDDENMNELLSKHREELHQIISRQNLLSYNDTDIETLITTPEMSPQKTMLETQETYEHEQTASMTPNSEWSVLRKLSSAERLARIDRMNLAELSDIRGTKKAISDRNKEDFEETRILGKCFQFERKGAGTASKRSEQNDLSIDSIPVQQKLHFTGVEDSSENENGDQIFSNDQLRQYTKQLEGTLARFVEERDALIRNQAEFEKHASGIFPSLENLNNQLSRIVQEKMLHSQANPKDCSHSEVDIQRERLQELESELTRWRHDAVVNDQNHAIELQQIKAQIISLVASGKLGDEKMGLLSDSVRKLQTELQNAVEEIVKRHCRFETQIKSALKQNSHTQSTNYMQPTQSSHVIRIALAVEPEKLCTTSMYAQKISSPRNPSTCDTKDDENRNVIDAPKLIVRNIRARSEPFLEYLMEGTTKCNDRYRKAMSTKMYDVEELVDYYFHRRLAAVIATMISYLPIAITPNQITLLGLGIGWSAALFLYDAEFHSPLNFEPTTSLLLASMLIFSWIILDCVDGQVARLCGRGTRTGRILDGLVDSLVITPNFYVMGQVMSSHYGGTYMPLAVVGGLSTWVHAAIYDKIKNVYMENASSQSECNGETISSVHAEYLVAREKNAYSLDSVLLAIYVIYMKMQAAVIHSASVQPEKAASHNFLASCDDRYRDWYRRQHGYIVRVASLLGLSTHVVGLYVGYGAAIFDWNAIFYVQLYVIAMNATAVYALFLYANSRMQLGPTLYQKKS
ncbi:unnamed protein product [Albugo candida]|uniref:Uncharacterized protein n=1 Tax=Albugo candida TaxID=65357 RepID=A0A024G0L6_9STRA|nr:unnamed protein product [Albugo candida]|eukprot:CCI40304.1 unnamed protein product [Albugo candida]